MSGTAEGGKRARDANLERYGQDYYRMIGSLGGKKVGVSKGFATNLELASRAGQKGGRVSKRGEKRESPSP